MDNLRRRIRQAELEIESDKARLDYQALMLKEEMLTSKGVFYMLAGSFALGYFLLKGKGVKGLIAAATPATLGSFLIKNVHHILPLIRRR